MNATVRTGAYLALFTALLSGVSVYINSFGVRRVDDPFVFTTAKNLMVGLGLAAAVLVPAAWRDLRDLTRNQWLSLILLGLVGGSIPFLLFFDGLRNATAPSAAFIHKTLFLWVALLAVPLLRERLGKLQLGAIAVLVLGQVVLVSWPSGWAAGRAEVLILVATLLWAVEAVIARRVLRGMPARAGALGRMGFGAIAMLAFLLVTGRGGTLLALEASQWGWVVITAGFLAAYVLGYYGALKRAPATLVTSVLVLGSVVTSALHAIFSARTFDALQIAGFALIAIAAALWIAAAQGSRVKSPQSAPATEGSA